MKSVTRIKNELRRNGWTNDTLSPLSIETYFALTCNLVDDDEESYSALMSQSHSSAINVTKYTMIATDKRVCIASSSFERRMKNRYVDFNDIVKIVIARDYYMPSRIYVTFKYKKKHGIRKYIPKTLIMESVDPTSSIHFKDYLLEKNKDIIFNGLNKKPSNI